MKWLRKSKAIFQILIFIFSVFAIPINSSEVSAANKCCQKSMVGEYCQYLDESSCDGSVKSTYTTCEKTYFCQIGCCAIEDGDCFINAPRSLCSAKGGTFFDDATCSSVAQCSKGCCVLGNECSYLTQTKCKSVVRNYPELQMVFDSEVENEIQCINKCRSAEKGCCVSGEECKWATRSTCNAETGELSNDTSKKAEGFFKDLFCSNNKLACDCAPHHHKGCLDYSDDVYWFDSCDNPEDIAEKCDYASGDLCGQIGDTYRCLSTTCEDTYADVASPNSGGSKKAGEGWCVYDASVGFGTDVVGSRHYRHICINGKELSYPCADYREEMCVSGVVDFGAETQSIPENPFVPGSGDFIEAACIENRWGDCGSCNYDETESVPTEEDIEDAIDCCQKSEMRDCFWVGDDSAGKCLPHVPPGFKFWEGEGQDTCNGGNIECTAVFAKSGLTEVPFLEAFAEYTGKGEFNGWTPVANEFCLSKDWLAQVNSECKSLGDCGAYFNVEGKVSMAGFDSSISDLTFASGKFGEEDVGSWTKIAKGEQSWQEPEKWDMMKKGVLIWGSLGLITGFNEWQKAGTGFWKNIGKGFYGESSGIGILWKGTKTAFSSVKKGILGLFGGNVAEESIAVTEAVKEGVIEKTVKSQEPKLAELITQKFNLGSILKKVNAVMTLYMFLKVWDALGEDTKKIKVIAECRPWQAPSGYNDCEKCNNREFKPCTEYTCKSLGASCGLINVGTDQETCVYSHPYDTKSPIIIPDNTVLTQGYSYSSLAWGFKLNPKIKAFSRFTFGIKTDEPSQCKITNKIGTKFDDMSNYFGTSLYTYNHSTSIVIPKEATEQEVLSVTNGGNYEFYVRCQDAKGNKNERDYIIQFSVDKGPDLTAPVIEGTSIVSGAYAPHAIPEMDLTVYVTEPGECRWDANDVAFETMNNKMQCSSSGMKITNNLYECTTILKGIKDNVENKFYFKCKDLVGNDMKESYPFVLFGTDPLIITEIGPNGRQYQPILTVTTEGGAMKDGLAVCGFSDKDNTNEMVTFLLTGGSYHEQELIVEAGEYTFYVECVDVAGNIAKGNTKFTMYVDENGPQIIRIYEDQTSITPKLHIETDEESTCEYSTEGVFSFGQGIRMPEDETKEHEAVWGEDLYYVICRDLFNNTMSVAKIFTP